jgi:hypothetical protein
VGFEPTTGPSVPTKLLYPLSYGGGRDQPATVTLPDVQRRPMMASLHSCARRPPAQRRAGDTYGLEAWGSNPSRRRPSGRVDEPSRSLRRVLGPPRGRRLGLVGLRVRRPSAGAQLPRSHRSLARFRRGGNGCRRRCACPRQEDGVVAARARRRPVPRSLFSRSSAPLRTSTGLGNDRRAVLTFVCPWIVDIRRGGGDGPAPPRAEGLQQPWQMSTSPYFDWPRSAYSRLEALSVAPFSVPEAVASRNVPWK